MIHQRFTEDFETICEAAVRLSKSARADALLLLLEGPMNWDRLATLADGQKLMVAADTADHVDGAKERGLFPVVLTDMHDRPVADKLAQALIEAVADDILKSGARVVALYSGFEPDTVDSISVFDLGDHLGRLTVRDLQQLETSVPLDTLQVVISLAVEIGREGREGKPVGTLFVVGDKRKVLSMSRSAGFDPVKGYSRKERNLKSGKVREGVKEFAQLDGAIIVDNDGTVEAAARYITAGSQEVTLAKGMGARHWAAASITKATKAVAVAVSESSGTVRIFQNGEVILRVEPFRRPMKWTDFEPETEEED
jgi:DNA integrity scanning protein DisA with diadenylate cyclase activity